MTNVLRNNLVTLAGSYDNDPVVVNINGIYVDVTTVRHDPQRGTVVLDLDTEELQAALQQQTDGN